MQKFDGFETHNLFNHQVTINMKKILFYALAFIASSCVRERNVENSVTVNQLDAEEVKLEAVDENDDVSEVPLPCISAYGHEVRIYRFPGDTSEIIGVLKKFDSIPFFDVYIDEKKQILTYNKHWSTNWIAVKYENDTAWINVKDSISFASGIEIFNQLIIQHRIYYAEITGIGYCESQVIDTLLGKRILESQLQTKYCQPLNDSLYLFNDVFGNLKIYNTECDSFVFEESGMIPSHNPKYNQLFYFRCSEGTAVSNEMNNEIPCKLLLYNYINNKGRTLFQADSVGLKPYYWGPDYSYNTEVTIEQTENNVLVGFDLYTLIPHYMEDDEFVKTRVRVDTMGVAF